jgi:hypothetical protein
MLVHPRVIRRTLPRKVERDFQLLSLGLAPERFEVLERAESGFDGRVATIGRADRPGAAGIAGTRCQRIVATLAKAGADGMNRRQIDDIEFEIGDAPQELGGLAEGAAARRIGPGRSREHFVPRAEPRARAVHPHAQRLRPRRARAVGAGRHRPCELVAERDVDAVRHACSAGEQIGACEQPVRRRHRGDRLPGPRRRVADKERALEQLEGDVLTGRGLDLQIAPPRQEWIDPRRDLVLVPPEGAADLERGGPFVGTGRDEGHRRFVPGDVGLDALGTAEAVPYVCAERVFVGRRFSAAGPDVSIANDRREDIVSVGEYDREHLHRFADRPLDREMSGVDRGTDLLDHDAAQEVLRDRPTVDDRLMTAH